MRQVPAKLIFAWNVLQTVVQVDFTLFLQLQEQQPDKGFCYGSNPERSVGCDGDSVTVVGKAVAFCPRQLPVSNHCRRKSRQVMSLAQVAQLVIKGRKIGSG